MKLIAAALALNVIVGFAAGFAGVPLPVALALPIMLLLAAVSIDRRHAWVERQSRSSL